MGCGLDWMSDLELLRLYARVMEKLKGLKIIRSGNSPISDYAEYLVSKELGLERKPPSNKEVDAIDERDGTRYQIKARQRSSKQGWRQLSIFRNLDQSPPPFDFCVAVIFDEFLEPIQSYRIPVKTVARYARYSKHQNGYILTLSPSLIADDSVKDILPRLRADSPVELDSGQSGFPSVSRATLETCCCGHATVANGGGIMPEVDPEGAGSRTARGKFGIS